jgi:hypothetical protein
LKRQKPPDSSRHPGMIHLAGFQTFAAYTGESLHGQFAFGV